MSSRQPSDAAQRQAAIDPSRSFLVQAPAGSGKTELLTDRLLALLALVNRPEEIVAITFTRKAAAEMQARVLAKLQAGSGPEPELPHLRRSWQLARKALERDAQMGWNLLQYPARLSIRTIDAFCAALVRGMPWLSALGGMPAVTEQAQFLYEEAARATLAMVDDVPAVARFIGHMDVDVRVAVSLLVDMLGSRDQWLPLLREGTDIDALEFNLHEAVEADLLHLAGLMPLGWSQELAPLAVAAATELLEAGASTVADEAGQGSAKPLPALVHLASWDGRPLDTGLVNVKHWQALADLLLTGSGTLRKTVNKNQGFGPASNHKAPFVAWLKAQDPEASWINALAQVRHFPASGYQPGQRAVLGDLLEVLWLAAAQLRLVFREHAEVDFIEIALRALEALGQADKPSDLLLSLDLSIRHLLIDEFQDTSHLQIRLLERLTAGWEEGDGRTLFLVGDPMQSIYRFRKAEVAWFLRVQEEGLGTVALAVLQLHENFRSQAGVVDWVNRTFRSLFPPVSNPEEGAISYTDSVAFHEAGDTPGVTLFPVFSHRAGAGTTGQNSKAAAGLGGGFVADEMTADEEAENLVVERVRAALARHPDSDKPVGILVRARTHLGGVVRRLSQAGIACRAVELDSLQSRQSVSDLVQLARALAHPADRLAWLSVLRSPLCGLTLNTLHAFFGQQHVRAVPDVLREVLAGTHDGLDLVPEDERQRLRLAARVLLDDGNLSGRIPFAAWLQRCWQQLGGALVYSSAADRSDIERVLRLVEDQAPYGGLDPALIEEALAGLYATPDSHGRAVEVMTVHKAKGLEFDTVVLMGLPRQPRGDQPPMLAFEHQNDRLLLGPVKARADTEADPVSCYLSEREKVRAQHEVDRLLYVAATRARKQLDLIVELSVRDGVIVEPVKSSFLGRLWSHIQQPELPAVADAVADSSLSVSGEAVVRRPERPLLRLPIASIADLETRLPVMAEPAVAASSLAAWQWSDHSGHEAITGTVAHAWLERLGRDGPAAWSAERLRQFEPMLKKQFSRAGLPAELLDQAVHDLLDTLDATLASPKGQWLLQAARAHREWALLDASGRVSIIDLAIADEHGWLIVDYKTGVPNQTESLQAFSQRMRVRHGAQLAAYCRQVSALDGRPARAALYFPRADIWIDLS